MSVALQCDACRELIEDDNGIRVWTEPSSLTPKGGVVAPSFRSGLDFHATEKCLVNWATREVADFQQRVDRGCEPAMKLLAGSPR